MKKVMFLIMLLFLVSCTNKTPLCQTDSDCIYGDETGSFCVHREQGGYDERIYDLPDCVCVDNDCVLRECENPPCYLG